MQRPAHIAIVGCGFTGTSALAQLIERYPVERVSVFESSGDFGPGYPYQTAECSDYLLNNTADTMSVFADRPTAFLEWLIDTQGVPTLDPKAYLPRALFGRYLRDVYESASSRAAAANVRIDRYDGEVTDIAETSSGVELQCGEQVVTADVAILTTGRTASREMYPAAVGSDGYVAGHIGYPELADVPTDACVYILGSSLSAFDVVNRLFSASSGCRFERDRRGALRFVPGTNRRRAVLCSRSGGLKAVQSVLSQELRRRHFTAEGLRAAAGSGGLSLRKVWRLVRQDAALNGVKLGLARLLSPYRGCVTREAINGRARELLDEALLDAKGGTNFLVRLFEDARFEVWDLFAERLLTPEAEAEFRRDFATVAMTYAAPCPAITAERLASLLESGRLEVRRGLSGVAAGAAGGIDVTHALGTEQASIVVNAIGATDRDVLADTQAPLIRSLVSRGFLEPHRREKRRLPGANIDMRSFLAVGATRIYMPNMLLWGPGFHTSSALTMSTVVDRLLRHLFSAPNP